MEVQSQRSKGWGGVVSSLNVTIEAMNLAKEISSITPAKAVFGSVCVLLTMIRDLMANKLDHVELGLECAKICRVLDRGLNGKKLDELSCSVCEAISQLTTTVAEIQRKVIEQSGRSPASRLLHAKNDKETIAAWKSDLNRILHVFNTELLMNVHHDVANTHTMVYDIHRNMLRYQEGTEDQRRLIQASTPGVPPPPPPRDLFGRDELIEKIVGLAGNSTPFALIGAGGIGKTSAALTALHDDRIKQRFGSDRWFIRCDQFPTSLTHFLRRLSKVIGAGVENPEDLTLLQPLLSSKEMFIILDNAESILDPRGTDAQEIYAMVEELSHYDNVCLCITSRISTIPPACEAIEIPTLSVAAARDTFYRIYKHSERPDLVDSILERLDFHPLSITLLATVAHHNKWDTGRLVREWERRRTEVLRTPHNKSLAATIELSLASPMFQELGPDARGLLGVVAFFPRGVDENNLEWLFPTVFNATNIFDNFCILSLTYRTNGFVTMLAPLRDHLCPKDPKSSPLLCAAKDRYFGRLSVGVYPGKVGYEGAQWIKSEDVNIEHLLDVFTNVDANSNGVWDTCSYFMEHIHWHKRRPVLLGPKIEALPDTHPSKPRCLFWFSQLLALVGNYTERKRLLIHALKLWRAQGDGYEVARTLGYLSDTNRLLELHKEGLQQARESLEIHERLRDEVRQAQSLLWLARLLFDDGQSCAAEEAASRAVGLLSGRDEKFLLCQCHRFLGNAIRSRGEIEKATSHLEASLTLAYSFNWHHQLVWIHYSLARLFSVQRRFDEAHAHVEHAKSYAVNAAAPYLLGRAIELQARVWYNQGKLKEAESQTLCATAVYERIGAAKDLEGCGELLRMINAKTDNPASCGELDFVSHCVY